jgi:Flp pilus assembly protein TadG
VKSLARLIREERGSASIEFVMLAIPLFLPIFIYLNQFASLSWGEESAQVLARESLRGYVQTKSDESGRIIAGQVIAVVGAKMGLSSNEINSITINIECSKSPCISANSVIRNEIRIRLDNGRTVSAIAQEHLSPWL